MRLESPAEVRQIDMPRAVSFTVLACGKKHTLNHPHIWCCGCGFNFKYFGEKPSKCPVCGQNHWAWVEWE